MELSEPLVEPEAVRAEVRSLYPPSAFFYSSVMRVMFVLQLILNVFCTSCLGSKT